MKKWKPFRSLFLQELIRHDGRGDHIGDAHCPRCGVGVPNYRCIDCHGGIMYCDSCMVQKHTEAPLHRVKKWNGAYFEQTSLRTLGLRVQLGHPPGTRCMKPKAALKDDFVVVHVNGIHQVGVDYCDCESITGEMEQLLRARWFPATVDEPKTAATFEVLEQFHILSLESKSSSYEFYQSLARLTDNTVEGKQPKDRYEAFMRIMRQWRHLKMLKRAGRGHVEADIDATPERSCALECPACPHPGKNLPDNWDQASPLKSWLYACFVAIDANFRLKRRLVSSEESDPSLGDGLAYVVKEGPYKSWLSSEPDLAQARSSCSSHKAVSMANTKASQGLAATGVGTIDCARHNMKLPGGVGDLQKGERYINMDYLLFSALRDTRLRVFNISYDICCQWHKNLGKRVQKLPSHIAFEMFARTFHFLVPKFHLPAHISSCRTRFSFHYTVGVGMTDGEAPERGWANINPVATSIKEMGPGHRKDTLDDHFGDWNWKKIVGLGETLGRKLTRAITQRSWHTGDLEDMEQRVSAETISEWRREVESWEITQTDPNPYESRTQNLTLLDVRLALAKREAKEISRGSPLIHSDITPGALIAAGIDIEAQQHDKVNVQNRANTLRIRIDNWVKSQAIHIPAVVMQRALSDSSRSDAPEKFTLWLPSELPARAACSDKLREIEWDLRTAQAMDALSDIRQLLQYRSYLFKYKDRHLRGQTSNTRALSTIKGVEAKTDGHRDTYRAAHRALSRLKPLLRKPALPHGLRVLRDQDIRAMPEKEGGEAEGSRRISWIWIASSALEDGSDESLHDRIRTEWCKARARTKRWSEEVELLLEEMRRTISYFSWQASMWDKYASSQLDRTDVDQEGSRAYAIRQAALRRSLAGRFVDRWKGPVSELSTATAPIETVD
ncbi:hypothetical protein CONPUDRAFT_120104 [Coniophora puteana RWD-64-598 SS2]|uniref:CxC2-like cysteine cluster KDZ transposase-associated domain-containing protein n=1 Tax=Coniophora puteana (strain RWD-64-598) TaxID=741705 RepID=A0A5M3MZ78_CONPW|nr:uncharacterized protein CONPUDRAFT_120104 [Coniophora puteana RWD-64-598 SS2]EIW84336.1 hypothetical protein CONPUDRAFT_120104 [Coniophora puteana RWD-64-598 SS2]